MTPAARLLGAVDRLCLFWHSLSIDDVAALQVAEREAEYVNETGERPDGEQTECSENMNLKPKRHRFHISWVRTERKKAAKPRADCRPVIKPVRIDVQKRRRQPAGDHDKQKSERDPVAGAACRPYALDRQAAAKKDHETNEGRQAGRNAACQGEGVYISSVTPSAS